MSTTEIQLNKQVQSYNHKHEIIQTQNNINPSQENTFNPNHVLIQTTTQLKSDQRKQMSYWTMDVNQALIYIYSKYVSIITLWVCSDV